MANLQLVHKGSADRPTVVLVHGLGGHPIDTWRHSACKENDCWPYWIGKDTDSDVWVLDYDADVSMWQDQAMPLPDQGDQVLDLLDAQPELQGRELVLVGHSMGGLVIKTLMVRGRSRGFADFKAVVDRVRGVVFIATPHSGSHLADLAQALRLALRTNVQLGNMAAHDPHLRTLHQEFRQVLNDLKFKVQVFAERKGVPIGRRFLGMHFGARVMVVNATSSDPSLDGVPTVPMAGDHFSICKPKNRQEHIHLSLCKFIKRLPSAPAAPAVSTSPVVPASPTLPSPSTPVTTPVAERAASSAAPLTLPTTSSPNQQGRLTGPHDNRIQPRESRVYGRETEVAEILAFLRQAGPPFATSVVGSGGTGKTEVCKAALKMWLAEHPDAVAYYVALGDRANAAELISGLANAVGVAGIDTAAQLLSVVPPATYYLDNLETVVEHAEGQALLQQLANRPGIRLLTSSRVKALNILGRPIEIGALPDHEAVSLFRDVWTGTDALPDDATLGRFVVNELGRHALSVTLTARLGDVYSYDSLLERWSSVGPDLLEDLEDQSRLGSLSRSLRLTADVLSHREGALALWTAAALFPAGVPEDLMARLEAEGGWSAARPVLIRHHLLARRNGRFYMLPPVARFALLSSARAQAGFDWQTCRNPIRSVFEPALAAAARIASSDETLAARLWILSNFDALTRLIRQELSSVQPDLFWAQFTHERLVNTYQFTAAQSLEILRLLTDRLPNAGSAFTILGHLQLRLGRPDGARDSYNRALELFEKQNDEIGQANTLRGLGELERQLGRTETARDLYHRARALFEKAQQSLGLANTLKARGDLELVLGRPDEARALYDRALLLFQKEEFGLGEANTLLASGQLERWFGKPERAREFYSRALSRFEKERDVLGQANTLKVLGNIEGRPAEAQKLFERALKLHEETDDGLGQANALQAIGDVLRKRGEFAEAEKRYQRALAFYTQQQEPMGMAYTFSELARCYDAMGNERQRDQALANAFTAGSQAGIEAVTTYVKDTLLEVTGSPEAAIEWLDRHGVKDIPSADAESDTGSDAESGTRGGQPS